MELSKILTCLKTDSTASMLKMNVERFNEELHFCCLNMGRKELVEILLDIEAVENYKRIIFDNKIKYERTVKNGVPRMRNVESKHTNKEKEELLAELYQCLRLISHIVCIETKENSNQFDLKYINKLINATRLLHDIMEMSVGVLFDYIEYAHFDKYSGMIPLNNYLVYELVQFLITCIYNYHEAENQILNIFKPHLSRKHDVTHASMLNGYCARTLLMAFS